MKRKKKIKMRGKRTHGWGSPKKHRGGGSKGGRGNAGVKKQGLLRQISKDRFIGKHGFKSLSQRRIETKVNAINLRDLVKLIGKEKEIELKKYGYNKVLGTGELKTALNIKADYFSKKAKEKIEKAGGKAIL